MPEDESGRPGVSRKQVVRIRITAIVLALIAIGVYLYFVLHYVL
jgi:hypothetical protein